MGTFGTSLLLSNTPMSPKVVNGSFAGIFEKEDSVLSPWTQWLSQLCNETKMSPSKLIDLPKKSKYSSIVVSFSIKKVHIMYYSIILIGYSSFTKKSTSGSLSKWKTIFFGFQIEHGASNLSIKY